jgi:cytochrome c oxidase cbb3-type subunit 3
MSDLQPGPRTQPVVHKNPDDENAYAVSEGQRLFNAFNCSGCHANGGGGMGPALMDERWIYGGSLVDIVASIRDGRPNGMPSFREKIPAEQIWQVAAYVRSLGVVAASAAAPARSDEMQTRAAENRTPAMSEASSAPAAVPPEQ